MMMGWGRVGSGGVGSGGVGWGGLDDACDSAQLLQGLRPAGTPECVNLVHARCTKTRPGHAPIRARQSGASTAQLSLLARALRRLGRQVKLGGLMAVLLARVNERAHVLACAHACARECVCVLACVRLRARERSG